MDKVKQIRDSYGELASKSAGITGIHFERKKKIDAETGGKIILKQFVKKPSFPKYSCLNI